MIAPTYARIATNAKTVCIFVMIASNIVLIVRNIVISVIRAKNVQIFVKIAEKYAMIVPRSV